MGVLKQIRLCEIYGGHITDMSKYHNAGKWSMDKKISRETSLLPPGYDCLAIQTYSMNAKHDDVIKWKYFPRYWPFVRGIHRSPVNYPHKGQWRGALVFSLICARINDWVNNGEAGELRRHRAHYDINVFLSNTRSQHWWSYIHIHVPHLFEVICYK